MLLGLLHELVRRRLWPIPLVALLIAVAAPLLFLKSSPGAAPLAPQASPTVDASATDSLPVRARRLLDTNSATKPHAEKGAKAADPFQGPKRARKAASPAASGTSTSASAPSSSGAAAAEQKPVPVVITDANGKTKKTTDTTSTSTSTSTSTDAKSSGSDPSVAVDVRYAAKTSGRVLHAVPRSKPFIAGGRLIASFVRYSPARKKAVFAVSPTTWVRGSVGCRHVAGQCRFVDLALGKHVWLSIVGPGQTAITRRLSIVHVHPAAGKEPRPPIGGSCLLHKLQESAPGDPAVLSDACE